MGDLHQHRRAAQQNNFLAPVELIGFVGRKAQRNIGRGRCLTVLIGSPHGVTAHRIVAAIATSAQLLEDPDQRQLFTSGPNRIGRQQLLKLRRPLPQLRPEHLRTVFRYTLRSWAISLIVLMLAPQPPPRPASLADRSNQSRQPATAILQAVNFWTPIPPAQVRQYDGSKLRAE